MFFPQAPCDKHLIVLNSCAISDFSVFTIVIKTTIWGVFCIIGLSLINATPIRVEWTSPVRWRGILACYHVTSQHRAPKMTQHPGNITQVLPIGYQKRYTIHCMELSSYIGIVNVVNDFVVDHIIFGEILT